MNEETTADIVTRMIQEHAKPPTITITISREDAAYFAEDSGIQDPLGRIGKACLAALEGER